MTASILLVEDNPADEKLTLRAFAKSGIANCIDVVRDGEEALDYLRGAGRHAARDPDDLPAVVLLDLQLPRLGGHGVLRQIRSEPRLRYLPVVVLTNSQHDEDVLRSYELGANAYVRKPVGLDELARATHSLGLFWLLVNFPAPRAET